MADRVTFETKCYEKDWEYLLKTNRLKRMIEQNNHDFNEKKLFINNVSNIKEVCAHAEKFVESGILTSYVVVDEFADEALKFFNIDRKGFKGGYYYSISELVAIYLCSTEYLLHFSSDSILETSFDWVNHAISRMECDHNIKVANPVWNKKYAEAKNESLYEEERFFIGFGFSDQCYLIRTTDFRDRIYNERNPASERYPAYGGELFEKRVDAWMRNHNYYRITYKHGSYIHKNF
ncbi:hypothetical protein [Neobacillus mesonae]|uniref:hypothetical protein n=1 Tax=Neobacillus mesonae TaxID=1193713 RepID=UPI002041C0D3|nr:hypothetical protein [Neobacillus mesonae]MCM3568568.1 hypothetical protein [Neobacillus mesonae]